MEYAAAARTDAGRKRSTNEDSYCLAPDIGLFLVADGMGGHAAGEVASRLAVDTIERAVRRYLDGDEPPPADASDISTEGAFLLNGIRLANRAIADAGGRRADWEGMGTTLAGLLVRDRRATLAHVGDSRIYRIRRGRIQQLSHDHSLAQEQVDEGRLTAAQAQAAALGHIITRALGIARSVEPDVAELRIAPGDALLLCSDGLSNLVEDEEMLAAVCDHPDLGVACQRLVDQANYRGGDDNITVLIVRAAGTAGGARRAPGPGAGR